MKLYQRILICGPARSGNTLMLHLIGAGFRNVRICHGERVPEQSAGRPGRFVVGKKPGAVKHLERLLNEWDLGVIFTMRDPRDSICSQHVGKPFWLKPDRWITAAEKIKEYRDHPNALLVRFENLIQQPASVQGTLAAKFGLAFRRPFSECHQNFDAADKQGIQAMHGARPLDRSRIGHWRETEEKRQLVADAIRTTDLAHWMEVFGYDPSRRVATSIPVAG